MFGQEIIELFEAIGSLGLILAFAVISFLDGFAIPTLPEAWLILIALSNTGVPILIWGLSLVLIGTAAAVTAQVLLYSTIKRVGVPKRLKGWMNRYAKFLIVSDEKLAFMNWLVPVVPFTGAFVAVCNWRAKRAFLLSTAGGLTKMAIIVGIAITFPLLINAEMVGDASLVLIIAVLLASLSVTYLKRKRMMREAERLGKDKCTCEVLADEKRML
jgi:hypothetical protein